MSNQASVTQKKVSNALVAVAWVPGMPQITKLPERNAGYRALFDAGKAVGQHFSDLGCKRVLYFSTQWISVLGQSFQAKPTLAGVHVDENWYELADLPFNFKVDVPFAQMMAAAVKGTGAATQLVDFEGFPADTGTIIANEMVNAKGVSTGMISCHVYADYAATQRLFATVRSAIEKDGTPTAVVVVSGLTTNFFTTEIDLREDHVRDPKDQEWTDRLLAAFKAGNQAKTDEVVGAMAGAVKTDMGLKGFAVIGGLLGTDLRPAQVLAQGPCYGSSNAVVVF